MSDDLDLDIGDEGAADRLTERQKRRERRKREAADKPASEKKKPEASDGNLIDRLVRAFERVAEQLDARGDEELSTAIREDSPAMSTGLVSLTRHVPFLRLPLVLFMDLLEPVLAFFRVGRILFTRWMTRRQRLYEEAVAAENGQANPAYAPQ